MNAFSISKLDALPILMTTCVVEIEFCEEIVAALLPTWLNGEDGFAEGAA